MEPPNQNSSNHENDSVSKKSSEGNAEFPRSGNCSKFTSENQTPENKKLSDTMEVSKTEIINHPNIAVEEKKATDFEKTTRKKLVKRPFITRMPPVSLTFDTQERPKHHAFGNLTQNQTNRQTIPNPPRYYPSRYNRSPITNQQPTRTYSNREINFNRFHTPQPNDLNFTQIFINPAYWSPYPTSIPANTPPNLAHLVELDAIFVIKNFEILELITGVPEPDIYLIQNKHGECLYYAYEIVDYTAACCCQNRRGLQLIIRDLYQNEVIFMNKFCGCNHPCFFCCYPVMEVYAPPSVPIGAILRVCESSRDDYVILDANENKMFIIRGSISGNLCPTCTDLEYSIHALDPSKTVVGHIRRQYGDFRTYVMNAEISGISFPPNLDVRIKSVFLGALFLIEIMYFS